MTRVVVIPADKSACGYYRMKLPAGAVSLVRPDWKVEVYDPETVQLGGDLAGNLWGITGVPEPDKIDLLAMQRVGVPLQKSLLAWARDTGIATVMDMDDAMWCIHPENPAHAVWNGDRTHWRIADAAAEIVDLVTVTTPALEKRYARHGRAEVLPNCVPGDLPDLLEPIRSSFDDVLTIGWAGLTATHPHDLEVVGDALSRIVEDYGVKVRVIGDAEGAMRDWRLKEVDQISSVPLGLPYYTALTSLDIALVPLQDSPFNQAKSYLKALEFASVGVPVVVSDTPAHRALSRTVPVHMARTPDEWYYQLAHLVENVDVREHAGKWNQEKVGEHHTYESQAEKWAQAWERAMTRRSRLS